MTKNTTMTDEAEQKVPRNWPQPTKSQMQIIEKSNYLAGLILFYWKLGTYVPEEYKPLILLCVSAPVMISYFKEHKIKKTYKDQQQQTECFEDRQPDCYPNQNGERREGVSKSFNSGPKSTCSSPRLVLENDVTNQDSKLKPAKPALPETTRTADSQLSPQPGNCERQIIEGLNFFSDEVGRICLFAVALCACFSKSDQFIELIDCVFFGMILIILFIYIYFALCICVKRYQNGAQHQEDRKDDGVLNSVQIQPQQIRSKNGGGNYQANF